MSEEGEQSSIEELAVPEAENLDAVEVDVEIDDNESESTGDEPATEEEELEEIERNGKKYQVPKSLKDEFLMHQDYTKKTQEVAEERRTFQAQQESFQKQREFQTQHMNEIVKHNQLSQELDKYKNVDWNALYDADPVEAMKLDRQYNGLKEEFNKTQTTLQQAERYQALQREQETANLLEQSRVTLASEIPDWTPKVASEVGEYLKSYSRIGVNDTILRDIDSGMYGSLPIVLARKAQLYDQLMKKASTKQTTPPPPPVTKVGAKATVTKSVATMSDKEFAAWRQKQIKNRS